MSTHTTNNPRLLNLDHEPVEDEEAEGFCGVCGAGYSDLSYENYFSSGPDGVPPPYPLDALDTYPGDPEIM